MTSTMTARYRGRCTCGQTIHRGDTVQWDTKRRAITGCAMCASGSTDTVDHHDMAFEDQCAVAAGVGGFGNPYDR